MLRDSVVCPQAPAFLARANAITALDGTHTIAYTNLICGLVADGVWPKFDVLMVFATQSSGVSLLNLTNATYSATSTATFTTDRGWFDSGVFGSILTNFNPIAAVGPQFTQNSAHISFWNLLNATSTVEALGDSNHSVNNIFPKFSDNNLYVRVNDAVATGGFAVGDPRGVVLENRSSSTARQSYLNGVSVGTYGASTSTAPNAISFEALSNTGAASSNSGAAISIGGNLSPTDVTNFYNRLRTYMTAVGVP